MSEKALDEAQFDYLRKSIRPVSIHRNPGMVYTDYDTNTAYARGRVVNILQQHKYRTIIAGKYLPSFDLIHYCELVPYTVDIYALQTHSESAKVITDELIVDIRRKKYEGLTIVPYEANSATVIGSEDLRLRERLQKGKTFVEHANQYKKQMICSHYNIDPKRYVIMNEEELFSKDKTRSTEEIEEMLFADRNTEMQKARDDLYVSVGLTV